MKFRFGLSEISPVNDNRHLKQDVDLEAPSKRRAFTFVMTFLPQTIFLAVLITLSSPCLAIGWFGDNLNGRPCSGNTQGFGPFDYTDPNNKGALYQVEHGHFPKYVEYLVHGKSDTLGGDLNYTLLAFPNHHRALYSVIRYALNYKTNTLKISPECYLQRALAFKPDDGVVHMLFGIYLHRKHKYKMALDQYLAAEKLEPKSAELHYNLGLLYFDLKEYNEAAAQARQAYAKGYPLPGLKRKLDRVGAWPKNQDQAKSQ